MTVPVPLLGEAAGSTWGTFCGVAVVVDVAGGGVVVVLFAGVLILALATVVEDIAPGAVGTSPIALDGKEASPAAGATA